MEILEKHQPSKKKKYDWAIGSVLEKFESAKRLTLRIFS